MSYEDIHFHFCTMYIPFRLKNATGGMRWVKLGGGNVLSKGWNELLSMLGGPDSEDRFFPRWSSQNM